MNIIPLRLVREIVSNSHSKVKARDIIPGWPRGRSTTVSYENRNWEYVDELFFDIFNRTSEEKKNDLRLDREYHLEQKRMSDDYRSYRYRWGYLSNGIIPIEFVQTQPESYGMYVLPEEEIINLEPNPGKPHWITNEQRRTSRKRNKKASKTR